MTTMGAGSRVVVAMSGGVDSSLTAALMVDAGHDVIGITMHLHNEGGAAESTGSGSCGTLSSAAQDARRVAECLNIPHHVLDLTRTFRRTVMEPFADGWQQGETPVPCAVCNRTIKFGALLDAARELGATALVTGHYVQRRDGAGGVELHRATDLSRDQSWFLFDVTREQLAYARFPLGDMPSKDVVRAQAEQRGLPVARKPDSQDICFVPSGGYARVVERLKPGALEAGEIVDEEGTVLGHHTGTLNFTVGQRRGINLTARQGTDNAPLYVLRIDPKTRRVVVGTRDQLARRDVPLRTLNWLGDHPIPDDGVRLQARVRSSQDPQPALLKRVPDSARAVLLFDEPLFGVAIGQAGVLYDGTRVLGGGWIG